MTTRTIKEMGIRLEQEDARTLRELAKIERDKFDATESANAATRRLLTLVDESAEIIDHLAGVITEVGKAVSGDTPTDSAKRKLVLRSEHLDKAMTELLITLTNIKEGN